MTDPFVAILIQGYERAMRSIACSLADTIVEQSRQSLAASTMAQYTQAAVDYQIAIARARGVHA